MAGFLWLAFVTLSCALQAQVDIKGAIHLRVDKKNGDDPFPPCEDFVVSNGATMSDPEDCLPLHVDAPEEEPATQTNDDDIEGNTQVTIDEPGLQKPDSRTGGGLDDAPKPVTQDTQAADEDVDPDASQGPVASAECANDGDWKSLGRNEFGCDFVDTEIAACTNPCTAYPAAKNEATPPVGIGEACCACGGGSVPTAGAGADCAADYCSGHGAASGGVGHCCCACHPGWEGATCSEPIVSVLCNEADWGCNGNGGPAVVDGACSCACSGGYSGPSCNTPPVCTTEDVPGCPVPGFAGAPGWNEATKACVCECNQGDPEGTGGCVKVVHYTPAAEKETTPAEQAAADQAAADQAKADQATAD